MSDDTSLDDDIDDPEPDDEDEPETEDEGGEDDEPPAEEEPAAPEEVEEVEPQPEEPEEDELEKAEDAVKEDAVKEPEGEEEFEEEEEEEEEPCTLKVCQYVAIVGDECLEMHRQEPWPQDVKLYQPYEVEQILMPDNANCLAVQAYLKMCGLDFEVEPRSNAEFMSPSGRVPFIKCGAFVVSELDPIIAFVNSKGVSLTNDLDSSQKADMRAYMSLVNTVLANAELYVCWCDSTTRNEVTKARYGSVFPWPLNHILTWQKKNQVTKRLGILGWSQKSLQEVYKEVESCCTALSERLDSKEYFFGGNPTDLDAVVYGHLYAMLRGSPSFIEFPKILRQYKDLVDLVLRIDQKFFLRSTIVVRNSLILGEETEERKAPPEEGEEGEEPEVELRAVGEGELEPEPEPQPEPQPEPEVEGEEQPPAAEEEEGEAADEVGVTEGDQADGGGDGDEDGQQGAPLLEIDQIMIEEGEVLERNEVEDIIARMPNAREGEQAIAGEDRQREDELP